MSRLIIALALVALVGCGAVTINMPEPSAMAFESPLQGESPLYAVSPLVTPTIVATGVFEPTVTATIVSDLVTPTPWWIDRPTVEPGIERYELIFPLMFGGGE